MTEVVVTTWGAGMPIHLGLKAAHSVTPGETLHVYVGGGRNSTTPGFNGGGTGVVLSVDPVPGFPDFVKGTHGAGASDVRQGGTSLSKRIQVTPGAGGWGIYEISSVPGYYGIESLSPGGGVGSYSGPNSSSGGGVGATAPASYPGIYELDPLAGYTGTSWAGAGGGGYVGGDSGEVEWRWSTMFPGSVLVTPTLGRPGTFYVAPTGTVIYPEFGYFGWYRDDIPEGGVYQWGADGRVDIDWVPGEPENGWHVGRLGMGSGAWTPA